MRRIELFEGDLKIAIAMLETMHAKLETIYGVVAQTEKLMPELVFTLDGRTAEREDVPVFVERLKWAFPPKERENENS